MSDINRKAEAQSIWKESTLKLYPPCFDVRYAHEERYDSHVLSNIHEFFGRTAGCAKIKMNETNMSEIYALLLQMDDMVHLSSLPLYKQGIRFDNRGGVQTLTVSIPPGFDSNKFEAIIMPHSMTHIIRNSVDTVLGVPVCYKQSIIYLPLHTKNDDCVTLQVDCEAMALDLSIDYDVIFRLKRSVMRYSRLALDVFSEDHQLHKFLFPTIQSLHRYQPTIYEYHRNDAQLKLINVNIAADVDQFDAVKRIVLGPHLNAPFVVYGPPGSGKTTIFVESVLQLLLECSENRILITSSSEAPAHHISLVLLEMLKHNIQLKHIKMLCLFSENSYLKENSNFRKNHFEIPDFKQLCQNRIIVCQISVLTDLLSIIEPISKNFFTHLFFNCNSAANEPTALIPIVFMRRNNDRPLRIILSGDFNQMQPLVHNKITAKYGLKHSLMHRLIYDNECYRVDPINGTYDRRVQIRLKHNHRSHLAIVSIYNHLYYENKIIPVVHEGNCQHILEGINLPINREFPIIFHATYGQTERIEVPRLSYCNHMEINTIVWYLCRLLIDSTGVNQSDIGIITFYSLQRDLIRAKLKLFGWQGVKTDSVEHFQEFERPILIATLVRSFSSAEQNSLDELGFVGNVFRLNVILSRAKSLLILVGNPQCLRRDSNYEYIIKQCERMDTLCNSICPTIEPPCEC